MNSETPRRHVKELDLFEVSIIDDRQTPCYNGTLIECRSEDAEELNNAKKDLESIINAYYLNMVDFEQVKRAIEKADAVSYEVRYNPNHDPTTGQFTTYDGSSSTTSGNGSYVHFVPEGMAGYGTNVFIGQGADSEENKINSYGQYTALLGGSQGVSITDDNVEEMKPTTTVQEVSGEQEGLTNEGESGTITEGVQRMIDGAIQGGVAYNEVEMLDRVLTEEELIDKVAGIETGDAVGSCASLALAYVANENGYDVDDFRGGRSRSQFARGIGYALSQAFPDACTEVEDVNSIKAVNTLLKEMAEDKTYILSAGHHMSVIKKSSGSYKYLDLQGASWLQASDIGWHTLTTSALKTRFGCPKINTLFGERVKAPFYLFDASKMASSNGYKELMGYINTPTIEQKRK